MTGLVKGACKNINVHLDTILDVNGKSFLIGGKVTDEVNANRAKVQKIKDQITGIQKKLAKTPDEYGAKLTLLTSVRADLLKAQQDAADDGVSSMLKPKGQEAQKKILKIMAAAKQGSEPLFISIKADTAKLSV